MLNKGIKPAMAAYLIFLIFGSLISIVNSNFNILAGHFNVSLSNIGYLISAMAIGRIATIFISGIISDRIGRKPVLILSAICISLCYTLIPLNTNYYAGFFLFILAGAGHGMADSTATALIFDSFPENPGLPIGLIQAFFCFGAMSTPIATSLLMKYNMHFGILFWVLASVALFVVVWAVIVKFPEKSVSPPQNNKATFVAEPKATDEGLILAVTFLLYSIATTILTTWSGTYLIEVSSFSETASIQILSFYNIGCITGAIFLSRRLDKIHPSKMLVFNIFWLMISVMAFPFMKSLFAVNALFVVTGFFAGINYSLGLSIIGEMFPAGKATASGVIMGMSALGAVITPLATGVIYDNIGIKPAYYTIYFAFVMLFVSSVIVRRKCKKLAGV